jgi:lysozyme family protein
VTAANFPRCLAVVYGNEGGGAYTNDPRDPGGPTRWGVTLAALSAYRGRPCTAQDVMNLTQAEASDVIRRGYWFPVAGDQLPAGVDLVAFDCAVNQGPGHAVQWLQRAAGAVADGVMGPATLAKVASADPVFLINAFKAERLLAYEADAGWATYGHGWADRDDAVSTIAISWATAA